MKKRRPAAKATTTNNLWAVMKAFEWGALRVGWFPLAAPDSGPQRFIPVFNTREQAVKWAGSDENVAELKKVTPESE